MKLFLNIIGFLFFTSFGVNAQEKQLCKAWKINYTIINGKKELPKNEEKNDSTIFYLNNSFKGTEEGQSISGKWKFDLKKKKILIKLDGFPVTLVLKIIKVSDEELIFESYNPDDDSTKKVFLSPIP